MESLHMYKDRYGLTTFFLSDTERLFLAAKEGDIESVRIWLDMGVDRLRRTQNGDTLLHIAAQQGHVQLVQLLLDRGLPFNLFNSQAITPLVEAVKRGRKQIVALLVSAAHENLHAVVEAFHEAVKMDRIQIVELFITTHAALVNHRNELSGYTALHIAARYNHIRSIQLLLQYGADISCKSTIQRDMALMISVRNDGGDALRVVKALIEAGADPNAANAENDVPGYYAAYNGNADIMAFLITHGLDIDWTDQSGRTMLHIAAHRGHYSVVRLLLCVNGSQLTLNREDNFHNTPLHLAAYSGHIEIVHLFLAHGAQADRLNHNQDSALHLAVRYQHTGIVRRLLEYSLTHLDTRGFFDSVPLQESLVNSTWEISALLLIRSASVHIEYDEPFMYPSSLNKVVNKFLIKKSLINIISNQIIRQNIKELFELFFQGPLSFGQQLAVEIWWRLDGEYRIALAIIASASTQKNTQYPRIVFSDLPLEIRQKIAYGLFDDLLPFQSCLNQQVLLNGMGFLLEWLSAYRLELKQNKPQPAARWLASVGYSVFNPWITQDRKIINQSAEYIATDIQKCYL